jgi:hypothetical protein
MAYCGNHLLALARSLSNNNIQFKKGFDLPRFLATSSMEGKN